MIGHGKLPTGVSWSDDVIDLAPHVQHSGRLLHLCGQSETCIDENNFISVIIKSYDLGVLS